MTKDKAFETAFKITSWFETGDQPFTQASGNFDGQGLSWGPRQTCIGQGSLQPLLQRMSVSCQAILVAELGSLKASFDQMLAIGDTKKQTAFVVTNWNSATNRLLPQWNVAFAALGKHQEIQDIFMAEAKNAILAVDDLAKFINGSGPVPFRTWCLAFDINTQNGGFASWFKAVLTVIKPMLAPLKQDDRDWMRTVVWLRAAQSYIKGNRPFALDVLSRKLLIVEGHGKFRGGYVDLDATLGVTDEPVEGL